MTSPSFRFSDLSIRSKVTLITFAASLVALFAVAGGLYAFQLGQFRQTFERELRTLSRIMAENCAAALAFNDAKTANEVLAPLGVKPEIQHAGVLGADGENFAAFGGKDASPPPRPDATAGVVDRGASWTVVEPIVLDGKRIGTFFIDADYAGPRSQLERVYLTVTAAVLAGSLLLAVLLTIRLQHFITRPIHALATASEAVARDHDYSVRVDPHGHDELGQLTAAFNHMLARIGEQDGAMRESEERFRSVAESASDAIIVADGEGRVVSWNKGARLMFGYEAAEMSGQPLSLIMPERFRAMHAAGLKRYRETGAAHVIGKTVELAGLRKNGEEFPFEMALSTWKTGAGIFFGSVMRDIGERKAAEEALRLSQQKLLDTSRLAGMAEVATGVLHNVGNVLNSVNISASLALDKLRASKVDSFSKAAALIAQHEHDLGDFITKDPQGQRLPRFLQRLSGFLTEENAATRTELEQLGKNVEHIKEIVAMQQSYASVTGVLEDVPAEQLVEDALQLNSASFARHGIEIGRKFQPAPAVRVDKHKVLQILINLLRNAKHAVEDAERPDPRIGISVASAGDQVCIAVADNGVGIPAKNLTNVFRHGFTTKKNGHGFGLHSGANAAKEMGGALSVSSQGEGMGATFTLSLPVATTASDLCTPANQLITAS